MLLHHVLKLDDVDLLRLLELSLPFLEVPAALRARHVRRIMLVLDLDDREIGLRLRSVALLRCALLLRFIGSRSTLAALGVRAPISIFELLLKHAKLSLDRRRIGAFERAELAGEERELVMEAADLVILDLGDLAKKLQVGDAIEIDHRAKNYRGDEDLVHRSSEGRSSRG
jgi:hypothetical protein